MTCELELAFELIGGLPQLVVDWAAVRHGDRQLYALADLQIRELGALGCDNNPELVAAQEARTPIVPRAEMLGELMRHRHGIAVAGRAQVTEKIGAATRFEYIDQIPVGIHFVRQHHCQRRMYALAHVLIPFSVSRGGRALTPRCFCTSRSRGTAP